MWWALKVLWQDREVEWSFFWECLTAEYETVIQENTDRESEMLLKGMRYVCGVH